MSTSTPTPQVDSNMNAASTLSLEECLEIMKKRTEREDVLRKAASTLSRAECLEIVKKHIQREDVAVESFAVTPLSAELNCFMGDYLRLTVSVSIGPRDKVTFITQLQFFVKSVALKDEYSRRYAMATLGYQKEQLFFGHLLWDVRKHLPCTEESSRWLGTVPRCYYLRPDLLVLEDLSLLGFRPLDPLEPLTLRQCEGVLRTVARFHGASIVYEEREGKRLANTYPILLEQTLCRKEQCFPLPLYEGQLSFIRTAHLLLNLIPSYTNSTHYSRQLHRVLDSTMEEINELLKPSSKYRNVLCHRGLWVNNMMFANDAKDDVLVRLVDFQNLQLAPPAQDVMVFLHLCMVRDMREAHGRRLQMLYYQTLAEVLHQHDLDMDSILPVQIFLQSYEDAKPVAVILAAYTMQVTMLPLSKASNLKNFMLERMLTVRAVYRKDKRFRDRITETMQELVETCLLPRMPSTAETTLQYIGAAACDQMQ